MNEILVRLYVSGMYVLIGMNEFLICVWWDYIRIN